MAVDVLDTPAAGPLVVRGGALRIVGYAAGTLVSLVYASLLARHLGPGDFGRYTVITTVMIAVGGITEAGMTTLGVREFSTLDGPRRDRLMSDLLGLRIALTLVGVVGGVAFAAAAGYPGGLVLGALAAGLGLVLTVLAATLQIPLNVSLRLGLVTGLELLRQLATLALVVVLVLAGAGVVPFLAVPIPVGLLVLTTTAALVRGRISLRPRFDRVAWTALLRMTVSFTAATVASVFYIYLSVIVMSLVASERQTGYFSASFRVTAVIGAVAGLAVSAAFPILSRAARDDRDRMRYGLERLFEAAVLAGSFFALLAALGAPVAMHILGGSQYDPAIPVLRIQSIGLLATFALAPWGFALIALHEHRALLLANLAALATSLVTVLVLASRYGAQGAAVGAVAGEFVLGVAYVLCLLRAHPGLRPHVGRAARALLVGGAATGLGFLTGLPSVPATLIGSAAYVAGIFALRAVPGELSELLPRRRG